MKFRLFIDAEREEETVVYAHKRTPLVDRIEELILGESTELIGSNGGEFLPFSLSDVYCFTVEDGKVYALLKDKKLLLKQRLYVIEDMLDSGFMKINQSTIVNIGKIRSFDASLSGALMVNLKNGHRDYVSRRQLKNVKERMGL